MALESLIVSGLRTRAPSLAVLYLASLRLLNLLAVRVARPLQSVWQEIIKKAIAAEYVIVVLGRRGQRVVLISRSIVPPADPREARR